MWLSKPERKKTRPRCKLPGFLRTLNALPGSEWRCPRCGDDWVLTRQPRGHESNDPGGYSLDFVPKNPRSLQGCGSWSCKCGPHPEQIYDHGYFEDPELDPVERPLLCMEHRRHLPCRRCE